MLKVDADAIALGVVGHTGRLGRGVIEAAQRLFWPVVLRRSSQTYSSNERPDVIFECARAEATPFTVDLAIEHGCALVLATSGRNAEQEAVVRSAAHVVPVVLARNMTLGHALQRGLTSILAQREQSGERTIIDRHPATKRDIPSATALHLASVFGDCKIEVLRYGSPVADHTVIVTWPGESLEITHRVASLEPAVAGAIDAIRAAKSLSGPGLYEFRRPDLISIRE